MLKTLFVTAAAAAAVLCAAAPAQAGELQAVPKLELSHVMGRWYEVARTPNMTQRGCQGGTSTWTPTSGGFAVVQACHKGALDGPLSEWKAQARVADPASNAKFKMSFFGGLITQEYWVLDSRPDQGWLILATHDGRYLWLMAQHPVLPAPVKAAALARIKQLGFDVGRLEFPLPARG